MDREPDIARQERERAGQSQTRAGGEPDRARQERGESRTEPDKRGGEPDRARQERGRAGEGQKKEVERAR